MNIITEKQTKKALELSLFAVILLVPLAFWLPAHESFEMPKSTVFYVLLACALFFFFLNRIIRKDFSFTYTPFSFPAAVLTFVFFLSFIKGTALNANAVSLHWQFFKFILANFIFYMLLINTFAKEHVKKILFYIFAAHLIIIFYGILQFFGYDFIRWVSFGEGRVYSTMGNPDYMSAQFTMLTPLLLAFLISGIKKFRKFLVLAYTALMLFLILAAQGRGAWLGFIGSTFYMIAVFAFFYGKDFFRKNLYLLGIILAFIIFLGVFFSEPIKKRIEHGFSMTSNSVAVRLFYWESALQMGMANPLLGAGVGGFSLNTTYYQRKVLDRWEEAHPEMARIVQPHVELYTHNDFLQTFSETGFIGLGVFLWLFAAFFFLCFKSAKKSGSSAVRGILLGLTGGITAFLINSTLNFPWRVTPTLILLFSFFAVFSLTENRKRLSLKIPSISIKTGILIFFIPLLVFSALQLRAFYANCLIKSGQSLFSAGRFNEAKEMFDTSLASNPRGTDKIELYLYGGNAYNALSETQAAVSYYKRGIEIFPYFLESHYNIANVYNNSGMKEKAVEEYKKALELNPKFTPALNNLANIYFAEEKFDLAVEMYTRALDIKPESTEARYNLGASYFRMNKFDLAYKEMKKVLEYDPDYELADQWIKVMEDKKLVTPSP
ncbi:MAG: tetratricopeptide repeat protein [Candidatus Goldiibacteriota bacterium]